MKQKRHFIFYIVILEKHFVYHYELREFIDQDLSTKISTI